METVAERDDRFRIMAGDDSSEPTQRGQRIIGRQQHAARGEAGTLFEMEVGDNQQALLFSVQRAGEVGREGHISDADPGNAHVVDIL